MELQVLNWVLTAAFGIIMYLGKRTIDSNERRVESLEKDIQDIKQNYLHKNDFKEFKTELRGMFDELKQDIRDLKFNNHGV